MVKKAADYFKKCPFVLPAVMLAVIMYAGFIRLCGQKHFCSLISRADITCIEGFVTASPIRLSGRNNYYRIVLDAKKCSGALNCGLNYKKAGNKDSGKNSKLKPGKAGGKIIQEASAAGKAEILLGAEIFESLLPGKLYSGKSAGLIEEGAYVSFNIKAATTAKKDSGIKSYSGIKFTSKVKSHSNTDTGCFVADSVNYVSWDKNKVSKIMEKRSIMRLYLKRILFSWGKAGGFLLALISGSREYLDEKLALNFRLSGLSHILALSGMHLSLFGGIARLAGKKTFGKKSAVFLELPAVLFFVWFAGRQASLFRALLCSLIIFLSSVFKIKVKSILNVISISFLIHILLFPSDASQLSFMLSYGALTGIVLFNEISEKLLSKFIPKSFGSSVSQSIGAQVITIPVSVKFFGFFTPGSVISSSFVSPLVTLFVYLGLFCILLSLCFPPFSFLCGAVLSALYFGIEKSVCLFSLIPKVAI